MNRFIKMSENDMVATALVNLPKGESAKVYSVNNEFIVELTALEAIPYGNKIALEDIEKNSKVIKYGSTIGETTERINRGQLVHVHNVKSLVVDIPPAFKAEIMRQMLNEKEG